MPSKKVPTGGSEPLKHNPFAGLVLPSSALVTTGDAPPPRPLPARSERPTAPLRVQARRESKGRSGKVVTRLSGLPPANLEAIAARLRKALGCGAVVELPDLLLQGDLAERAMEWLEAAGDLRAITVAPAKPASPRPPDEARAAPAPLLADAGAGTRRDAVRRGQRVAIVQKADQSTGKLTEGVVRDLLTSAPTHPRGIKVRLETGEVGRVKIVFG